MTYLTENELDELNQKLDQKIENFPLLLRNRNQAVFHILLVFSNEIDKLRQDESINQRTAQQKIYNGLNHSIRWILLNCPNIENETDLVVNLQLFREAEELLNNAAKYSEFFVMMSLLYKGRNRCRLISPNVYEISLSKEINQELELGRRIIAASDDPQTQEEAIEIDPETYEFLKKNLRIKRSQMQNGKYSYKPEILEKLKEILISRNIHKWYMNPDWDLGGYTFGQFAKFTTTLRAMEILHRIGIQILCKAKKTENARTLVYFNSLTMIMSKASWISELTKKTGLNTTTINLIMDDLMFDPTLYIKDKQKTPHVLSQTFFDFGSDRIGLSNKIIQISNLERNIWALISVKRNDLFNILTTKKEEYWIGKELVKIAATLKLLCFSSIKYKSAQYTGNIDLLLIDEKLKFGLVAELKWNTASDNPSGVESTDEDIIKGVGQAVKSLNWINLYPEILSQKIKIKAEILKEIDFKPIVITKEDLPSGYLDKLDVPVITENLFKWMIVEPHNKNLIEVWTSAVNMDYLPKENIHFKPDDYSIDWQNIQFILKNVSCNVLEPWDQKKEIK